MNVSTDTIAVIQARLPYTDRRALSEAWFSAFHLASDGALPELTQRMPLRSASPTYSWLVRGGAGEAGSCAGASPNIARQAQTGCGGIGEISERGRVRWLRTSHSMRPRVRAHVTQMRFTLGIANARIALHVRREAGKLIVIALCGARHAELVHRTLTEVAARMRSRGTHVEAAVRAIQVRL